MSDARSNSHSIFKINGPLRVIVCFITLWSFFNEAIIYGAKRHKLYGRIKSRLNKLFSIIWRDCLFRGVALITAITFFITSLPIEKAWAARTPLELTRVGSTKAGSPGSFKELNAETFNLPAYLGHIKDSWAPDERSTRTIIHVQDAHCNYAAQRRIAKIIKYLNREYGIDTVNLEGGKGEYELSIFTNIHDKAIRKKVADYFVKEGLVNGAEYFAINNPDKVTLWGVEDAKLYLKNLNIYRDSLKHKETIDKYLKELDHILDNLKRNIYSNELLELDAKYSQHKANKLEFKDYLTYLIEKAQSKAIDVKSLTNIYLLSQSLEAEEKIDFKIANIERNRLIDEFEKMLSKKELEKLIVKTVEFKDEKISRKDYYAYLVKKAKLMNFDLKKFPELQKYIVYTSMYEAIDKSKITKEIDALENKIKEVLYENATQRELNLLSKNFALTKNIFRVSLTKDDYIYYRKNEKRFNTKHFVSFINREAPLYKIAAKLDKDIADLDRYRKDITSFYEYSFKRDKAFINNIRFTGNGSPTAILVTGGFHTENLCELFKKNNISYVSIMPTFRNGEGYESPYFGLLAGNGTALLKKLYPLVLSASAIQIASMLSNAIAPEVWGRANIDAFRAAVLVRAEIAKGKDIADITKEGKNVIFHMADGTTERMPVRALLDAVHQHDIDGQMERLSEDDFEDMENIEEILDELIDFLRAMGASQEVLDRVEALKGKNVDGRAFIRLVSGVAFRGHAGGQGIRLNGKLKVNRKLFRTILGLPAEPKSDSIPGWVGDNFGDMSDEEIEREIRKAVAAGNYDLADMLAELLLERQENRLKGVLLHEIIAGLFGDHFLAEQAEQAFLAGQTKGTMLAGIQALRTGIWDMTPEERLGVDRDFAKEGSRLSLLEKLNRMFAKPKEQKTESATRVAALEMAGQSPIEYYGNRKAYLKALLDMEIKDNILNEGVRDIQIEAKGSDIIQHLMVTDTNGNRFIVIVKNNIVQEVAMPVRRAEADKISPKATRADKFEFVVVNDHYAREIFQVKLVQHRENNRMAGGKFMRKKFAPNGGAKVMCGFLTEDEIEEAKKAIQNDFLLAHLFELIDNDFPDVNLRGFIAIEVPKDHGGYYDGERVFRILGEGFDRGLYAHELMHHVYRKLERAASRVRMGRTQPGDERLVRLFEKIQTHLQEDKHRKLFDWLRRDKLYADRVIENPVYLRNEALAYLVGAIFDRKTIELHSGYQITFRDIQLLVELGILPSETYGNSELFEGVDLDAPLPATFHQVVELYRRMKSISQVLSDVSVLQAIKENAKDGVGNLMNLVNWMIVKGHFKEVEVLLIKLGQDTELEYEGKWEELLFSFFLLYHSWTEADMRNAENIFNLLSIQLEIDTSAEVFLKIFASKVLNPERLRQFFTAHADDAQLKDMLSNLLITLFSKLDKSDRWDYKERYVLYRAIGMIYYILGMEEVAQEFFENANGSERMLDIVDNRNILSLMASPEESLSPEEKERKLKEAIEGQGFDFSIFAKAISEFNFAKFNPAETLGSRFIENKDRILAQQEVAPLFTPSMVEGFSLMDDNIRIDPQLFKGKVKDFKIKDIDHQLNLQIQPINTQIKPLSIEFHNIEIKLVEHKAGGRIAAVVGFLRMLKNIAKILLNPKVDRSVKTLLLRLTWETFKTNFIRGFFDDINIADVGLDAPEHRDVNKIIKQAALEGRLEDRGKINGKRVIVIKGVDVLVAGQRAHAGIERNVIYIAEGAYNETLAQHETIELQLWQQKALELAGMDKDTDWNTLTTEQKRELKQGLRQWIRENFEEAQRLEAQFHNVANFESKTPGGAELIRDNRVSEVAGTDRDFAEAEGPDAWIDAAAEERHLSAVITVDEMLGSLDGRNWMWNILDEEAKKEVRKRLEGLNIRALVNLLQRKTRYKICSVILKGSYFWGFSGSEPTDLDIVLLTEGGRGEWKDTLKIKLTEKEVKEIFRDKKWSTGTLETTIHFADRLKKAAEIHDLQTRLASAFGSGILVSGTDYLKKDARIPASVLISKAQNLLSESLKKEGTAKSAKRLFEGWIILKFLAERGDINIDLNPFDKAKDKDSVFFNIAASLNRLIREKDYLGKAFPKKSDFEFKRDFTVEFLGEQLEQYLVEEIPPMGGGMDPSDLMAFAQSESEDVLEQLIMYLKDGLWHQTHVVLHALKSNPTKLAKFEDLLTQALAEQAWAFLEEEDFSIFEKKANWFFDILDRIIAGDPDYTNAEPKRQREMMKQIAKHRMGPVLDKIAVTPGKAVSEIKKGKRSAWFVKLPMKIEQFEKLIDSVDERAMAMFMDEKGNKYLYVEVGSGVGVKTRWNIPPEDTGHSHRTTEYQITPSPRDEERPATEPEFIVLYDTFDEIIHMQTRPRGAYKFREVAPEKVKEELAKLGIIKLPKPTRPVGGVDRGLAGSEEKLRKTVAFIGILNVLINKVSLSHVGATNARTIKSLMDAGLVAKEEIEDKLPLDKLIDKLPDSDVRERTIEAIKSFKDADIIPKEIKDKLPSDSLDRLVAGLSDLNIREKAAEAIKSFIDSGLVTKEQIRNTPILDKLIVGLSHPYVNAKFAETIKSLIDAGFVTKEQIRGFTKEELEDIFLKTYGKPLEHKYAYYWLRLFEELRDTPEAVQRIESYFDEILLELSWQIYFRLDKERYGKFYKLLAQMIKQDLPFETAKNNLMNELILKPIIAYGVKDEKATFFADNMVHSPGHKLAAISAAMLGGIAAALPDNHPKKQFYKNIYYRVMEIEKGTLRYEDIELIYSNPIFLHETKDFGSANQFSVARTIELLLRRFNLSITDKSIRKVLPLVLDIIKRYSSRFVLNRDISLIVACHEEGRFKPSRIINFARRFGIKKETHFKGPDYKERILDEITKAALNTTIWFNGHGGENHFWLSEGQAGEEKCEDLAHPGAISYEELANALIARAQNGEIYKNKNNIGDLSDVTIIVSACFSADFIVNTLNTLVDAYNSGEIKELPLIITEAGRGTYGHGDVFLNTIKEISKNKKSLIVSDIFSAEEHAAKDEDFNFFLPMNADEFQHLKTVMPTLPAIESEETREAPETTHRFISPILPIMGGGMDARDLRAFAQREGEDVLEQVITYLKDGLWHLAHAVRKALKSNPEKLAEFEGLFRQAVVVESLLSDPVPGFAVRVLVARPEDVVKRNGYEETAFGISKGLAGNGFSVLKSDSERYYKEMDKKRQIMPFELNRENMDRTADNIIDKLKIALNGLPSNGGVAVYVPEIEDGRNFVDIVKERIQKEENLNKAFGKDRIILVPDKYTDLAPDTYPEYAGRLALARHLNALYKGDETAFDRIKWLLQQLDESPDDIVAIDENGRLVFLRALKIRAIDYEKDIRQWQRTQKAIVTSL